jgi:hypothetical protein
MTALMMEAARSSETAADHYFTRQYITEDKSELPTRRRENLKSHKFWDIIQRFEARSLSDYNIYKISSCLK